MDTWGKTRTQLATTFEVPTNEANTIGSKMYTWFVAPDTTQYRFHLSCNDYCDLYMGLDTSDPLSTRLLKS